MEKQESYGYIQPQSSPSPAGIPSSMPRASHHSTQACILTKGSSVY